MPKATEPSNPVISAGAMMIGAVALVLLALFAFWTLRGGTPPVSPSSVAVHAIGTPAH